MPEITLKGNSFPQLMVGIVDFVGLYDSNLEYGSIYCFQIVSGLFVFNDDCNYDYGLEY